LCRGENNIELEHRWAADKNIFDESQVESEDEDMETGREAACAGRSEDASKDTGKTGQIETDTDSEAVDVRVSINNASHGRIESRAPTLFYD